MKLKIISSKTNAIANVIEGETSTTKTRHQLIPTPVKMITRAEEEQERGKLNDTIQANAWNAE